MASLVVWTGSRWRRVYRSGSVAGWRQRARFLLLREGALRELSSREALRRLRRGPRAPRAESGANRNDINHEPTVEQRDACVQTEAESDKMLKHIPAEGLTRTKNHQHNKENDINRKEEDKENINLAKRMKLDTDNTTQLLEKINKKKQKLRIEAIETHNHSNSDVHLKTVQLIRNQTPALVAPQPLQDVDSEELIRNFIEHQNDIGVDLYQFDCNEAYHRAVLSRFNPVVVIKRDAEMEHMLHSTRTRMFARELGLEPTPAQSPAPARAKAKAQAQAPLLSSSSSDDSSSLGSFLRARNEASIGSREATPRREAKSQRKAKSRPLKIRRSCVPAGRDYSSLEDHAIVAWLSAAAERACAVNGNRVWRELQASYESITGVARSWHSLRNRYLRYILPALDALALPQRQVQRLRAKAALGTLKSRRSDNLRRRNSLFAQPALRSAFVRRALHSAAAAAQTPTLRSAPARAAAPRAPELAPARRRAEPSPLSATPSSPARLTRSAAATPDTARRKRSLNNGDARSPSRTAGHDRPAAPRRKTPGAPQSHEDPPPTPSPAAASSPLTYRSITHRFALRHRSTPASDESSERLGAGAGGDGGVGAGAPRTRRLYNP